MKFVVIGWFVFGVSVLACPPEKIAAQATKRIAIVHHHLNSGGVSRVIENAVGALEGKGIETVVLSSIPAEESAYKYDNVVLVPDLKYSTTFKKSGPKALQEAMIQAASEYFGGPPDLWHFHNHSLGKNPTVTAVVSDMAAAGIPMVLQLHDFAENGRPINYKRLQEALEPKGRALDETLYPVGPHIQYAVLNGRDYQNLVHAGFPKSNIRFLPNPVWFELRDPNPMDLEAKGIKRLFLYPTRSIRRKNMGEFLYWAAVSQPGDRFATTLAPRNPEALPIYEKWVKFARELGLPVQFEAGDHWQLDFPSLLASADSFVTTSVEEGFGLAYMEAALAGKPIFGRDLSAVTGDFREEGIQLGHLYKRLNVHMDYVGRKAFEKLIEKELRTYLATYGRGLTSYQLQQALRHMIQEGFVDFGVLNEKLQRKAIKALRDNDMAKMAFQSQICAALNDKGEIERNRQVIESQFGIQTYGNRLAELYGAVAPTGTATYVNANDVLGAYLDPKTFCLLRN